MNTNFKQSSAYELAEIIEDDMEEGFGMGFLKDAVAMLRQQADRIAELEKELSWWRTNFKLPTETNEPRPNWLYTLQTKPENVWTSCLDCGQRVTGDSIHTCSPQTKQGEPVASWLKMGLPQAPQTKPLSDEEIWSFADMVLENSDVIGFARAIEERHGIK